MDESERDRRYYLCVAIVDQTHVNITRKQLNCLHGQPIDCNFGYEHNPSELEPLCWIADAAGWCFGAGGDWRRRIMPIVDDVIEL